MEGALRFLFFGDLVGKPGRMLFAKWAPRLKEKYKAAAVIVNGENSGDMGRGINPITAKFLFESGADVITTGNHIWAYQNVFNYLDEEPKILRPENFPSSCPGHGHTTFIVDGHTVAIVNLQGQVFMRDCLECPFKTAETTISYLKNKTNIIFVDFHAEATSEKQGLGFFLDGKVSAVLGTHSHVQTADERILPAGTAYISDLGFAGSRNSMLGMEKEGIIRKLMTTLPSKFKVEFKGPFAITGVCVEVDTSSGKANSIERFFVVDDEMEVSK